MLGILMLAPKAGSQEKTPISKIDTLIGMQELDNVQRLKPGYVVSIRILEDKRDAIHQIIAVTGEIQAPYLGLLKADGLTCRELAFKAKSELEKSFFEDATVLVTLEAVGVPPRMGERISCPLDPPFVVAFGTIAKQGKYDLAGIPDHKLSAFIKRAGGVTSKSATPKIRVIRKTAEGNKAIVVDVKALLKMSPEADLVLQASDVVIVE
jgi:polysaccharide export outer membrane protein